MTTPTTWEDRLTRELLDVDETTCCWPVTLAAEHGTTTDAELPLSRLSMLLVLLLVLLVEPDFLFWNVSMMDATSPDGRPSSPGAGFSPGNSDIYRKSHALLALSNEQSQRCCNKGAKKAAVSFGMSIIFTAR